MFWTYQVCFHSDLKVDRMYMYIVSALHTGRKPASCVCEIYFSVGIEWKKQTPKQNIKIVIIKNDLKIQTFSAHVLEIAFRHLKTMVTSIQRQKTQ